MDLIRQDRITGIRDIRDESSKDGLRIVFEVKQNADANAVPNQLYLTTRLQESYAANMMGIVDGQPTQLTLPVILHAYVRHREEVVVRRTEFDLEKVERRMHILEGLIRAQDRIDDVIAAGRSSESKAQFERVLMGQGDHRRHRAIRFLRGPSQVDRRTTPLSVVPDGRSIRQGRA